MGVILSKGAYKKTKRVVVQATSTPIGTRGATNRRVSQGQGGGGSDAVLVEVSDNNQDLPSYNCDVFGNGFDNPATGTGVAVPVVTHPLTQFAVDTRMVAINKSALTAGEV